ncbi:MAG TPA: N-acetylmuramoyl-L-alanine amidase, partial [Limnochordia bacterium]|nr:N-acetylmuramoyl-L-alanine amidase [Limnochordia bacterium]
MSSPRFVVLRMRTLIVALIIAAVGLAAAATFVHAPGLKRPLGPLSGKLVMIDPGHGGIDGGCSAAGVLEKGINLAVGKRLAARLSALGAEVELTRSDDVALDDRYTGPGSRHARDLKARVQMARATNAQVFVSLHVNASSDGSARGVYGFYREGNQDGRRLALMVVDSLAKAVGDPTRRVLSAPFYVLRSQAIPSVLIEMGFVTNAQDRALLVSDEGQERTAQAIAAAVMAFLLEPADPSAPALA